MTYEIVPGQYLGATSAGAHFAVGHTAASPFRQVLLALLADAETPELTAAAALRWTGRTSLDEALGVLFQLQSMALVQGSDRPRRPPAGSPEAVLPGLLAPLAGDGRAVLADELGFQLAATGFDHATSEELAALSADLASLHARHEGMLARRLAAQGGSWGLLDVGGASQLGIWPLFIGRQRFALALAGRPVLHHPAFADLVWYLSVRYGD
jgi:hypothetical protein